LVAVLPVPSPKLHDREAIVPSPSLEVSVKVQSRSMQLDVNDAAGGLLIGVVPPPPGAISFGLKTVASLTSSSGSLVLSRSPDQLSFPSDFRSDSVVSRLTPADRSSAAAPATCGDAIDVPDFVPYPFGTVERMQVPGAMMSIIDP
jgi:hypothetical protein